MNQILLILHLFGFAAGVAASIGNMTVMRLIGAAPADAPILGKVPPALSQVGKIGLGLLWITGLILIWSKWGGPQNLPAAFWWKFVLVLVVTGGAIGLGWLVKEVQAGRRKMPAVMPQIGMAMAAAMVLIVIFAVYAFD